MRKICIIHDTFLTKGGAERLMLLMGGVLDADFITGLYSDDCFSPEDFSLSSSRFSVLGKKRKNSFIQQFSLQYCFFIKIRKKIKEYKTIIFSGDTLIGAFFTSSGTKKIYYCHTPPRYMFDQKNIYRKKVPYFFRFIYDIWLFILTKLYKKALARMDVVFVNSKNTGKRLKKYTGYSSEVIYPPVDPKFVPSQKKKGDFFLSCTRFAHVKRVDRIMHAFSQIPDRKLICTYGENDPQKELFLNISKKYSNIICYSGVSDEKLLEFMQKAKAVIYIPENEDFGMVPIEAMACGTPVVGVREGGVRETVIDKKTGVLLNKNPSISAIKKGIEVLSGKKITKKVCVTRGMDFSFEEFKEKIIKKIGRLG